MLKIKKIKLGKLKKTLSAAPKFLAENYFSTFLVMSFFSVILAMVIFYQYGINIKDEQTDISDEVLSFDEYTYQEVLVEWQKKIQESSEVDSKEYKDPFNKSLLE
ncbi:MAG: hypothetical protein ABIH36_00955 [bacterium]